MHEDARFRYENSKFIIIRFLSDINHCPKKLEFSTVTVVSEADHSVVFNITD